MADNEKLKQKPKSSFFGAKSSGKKESKKKMIKNQRKLENVDARGSSAENISENDKEIKTTESLTEESTSKTNLASSSPNQDISEAKEVGDSSTTNSVVSFENLEGNSELTSTSEQLVLTEATEEQDAGIQSNENAEPSSATDAQENDSKSETIEAGEQFEVSREQNDLQDANHDRQIESDVENKANEITTGDSSKKHGTLLASFRRNKKKSKLSKHSQDAESVEKLDGNPNDIKEATSEHPKAKEDETEISKEGEKKKQGETGEQEETSFSLEKNTVTAEDMVNEKLEEQQATKKGHGEKKSGPFASFRKNKKKAHSVKQQSTSAENETKFEDTTGLQDNSKENAVDNIPQPDEKNIVELEKETTVKQHTITSGEEEKVKSDKIPALSAAEQQVIDESCSEAKNVENKQKRGKRFGSFSGFSRTKKAPKMLQRQQTAPASLEIDNEVQDPTNSATQEQGQPTRNLITEKLKEGGSTRNTSKELAPAEVCKDEPSGSQTQVPEISTVTGNEDCEHQQEGLVTIPEKKKSGLKKRMSKIPKIKLHSSKSKEDKFKKENQVKESAQNQPEVDLQDKKQETGTDNDAVSQQVKRKKTGSFQKKISKALKINKSEQLEMNELHDDSSASEDEECQSSLDNKTPIAPNAAGENQQSLESKTPIATVSKEEITETDGKKEEAPLKQVQEIVPEIVEVFSEKDEKPSDELSPSSTSGSAAIVKRVTFVLNEEEKQSDEPETFREQSQITVANSESESTENNQEASPDKDGVTLVQQDDVTSDKEDGVFDVYGVCRSIMKQVFHELLEYVEAKVNNHQESADNQDVKPDEDMSKLTLSSDIQPKEAAFLEVQEDDSGNLSDSSVALSMESLESTGTVVMLESSESDLESVSPMPEMMISKSMEEKAQETSVEKNLENQMAENEVKVSEKKDEKTIQVESSGPACSSEATEHENDTMEKESGDTPTVIEKTDLICSQEQGNVDRTAETDVEQSIERNLEKSLEKSLDTSLQYFLSQSLKEEWIVVRPRLEISQEMSHQFKALALESYAHRPACCKIM